jgi:hypothetical protein
MTENLVEWGPPKCPQGWLDIAADLERRLAAKEAEIKRLHDENERLRRIARTVQQVDNAAAENAVRAFKQSATGENNGN